MHTTISHNRLDLGEAGSVAVLPRRYAPMGPGSIPSPGAVCAFGFQSILASVGFLRVLRFSPLHLKLDFLNKSVSKHFMEVSLNAFALLGFACFQPNVINLWNDTIHTIFIFFFFNQILLNYEVFVIFVMHQPKITKKVKKV